jgi:hypothetical protein
MVALTHLEKFIADHPNLVMNASETMKRARKMAGSTGDIGAAEVERLLGKATASKLFELMSRNAEYIRLSFESARQKQKAYG